jgi:hypothetical protein
MFHKQLSLSSVLHKQVAYENGFYYRAHLIKNYTRLICSNPSAILKSLKNEADEEVIMRIIKK